MFIAICHTFAHVMGVAYKICTVLSPPAFEDIATYLVSVVDNMVQVFDEQTDSSLMLISSSFVQLQMEKFLAASGFYFRF